MKGNLADFKIEVEHTIKDVLRKEYLSDISHAIGYMPSKEVQTKQPRPHENDIIQKKEEER